MTFIKFNIIIIINSYGKIRRQQKNTQNNQNEAITTQLINTLKNLNSTIKTICWKYGLANEADDIIQEVAINALKSIEQLRDISKIKPWLIQITSNVIADHHKRGGNRILLPLETTPRNKGHLYHQLEDDLIFGIDLNDALKKLNERERKFFDMHYNQGLEPKEIAEQLNVGVGAVKSILNRITKKIRKHFNSKNHSK